MWDIDNVNVYLDVRTPYNYVVSDITNTSAYLSWDMNGNCSYFEVEYSTNSDFSSAINVPTNNKYFSLTDLASGTTYYTRVRAKYIDNNNSYFTYGSWATKTFTTTCDAPTGLAVNPTYITETNIRVTWDDNLIKDVDLEYKQSNQTEWLTLAQNVSPYNYYNMSVSGLNLQQGTLYQVRAKFPCSDWCEPIEFRTAFGGLNELMYTFENGMPADFTVTGAGAENVSLSTEQSFGADPHSLKYNFVSGNPYPSPGIYTYVGIETYLKTYQFNDFMVYFDMYCTDTPGTAESVELQYDAWVMSGSGTWQSIWRSAGSWGFSWSEQGWVERKGTFSIPTELQGGVSKLRFRLVFTDHGSGESTYVDNIHIFPKGDCSNINTNYFSFYDPTESSISFDWVDPNYDASVSPVAHSNGFCIRYRNLTIPTNTNTGWIEEYVYADNTNPQQQYTYTLNDLDPSSYYLINIRTICPDGGSTGWLSTNLNMGTDCQAYKLTDMQPFTEDFDNLLLNPACWTYTTNWNRIYDGYGGHNWCLRSNYNPVAGWNDYIDTPEIELDGNYVSKGSSYLVLRFWTKCSGEVGTGNKVKVLVGNEVTEIYELPAYGCDEWQLVHLSLCRFLPSTGSNTISVRFDHDNSATEWFIDDVVITSFNNESYGMSIFDNALSNNSDWNNSNNWYPVTPTYSPSLNVTIMSRADVPNECNSTVGTLRFGTQGYLDINPGGELTVGEMDIPENKVNVEGGGTLNIGTASFGFDKIFASNEGNWNITTLNQNAHHLTISSDNATVGTANLTAPGSIAVTVGSLTANTVNINGESYEMYPPFMGLDIYPDGSATIGTLNVNAARASYVCGEANITTLTPGADLSVIVGPGGVLNANTITGETAVASDWLLINDGGQVKSANPFFATIEKNITGYGASNVNERTGWNLIATPTAKSVNQVLVPMSGEEYLFNQMDVYWFNQGQELEWINPKNEMGNGAIYGLVTIMPQKGYLYARQEDATLQFAADMGDNRFPATTTNIEVSPLDYIDNANLPGWNLIGNPYTCNAYVVDNEGMGVSFYRMNAAGDAIVPADTDNGGYAIKPCEGVFVNVADYETPLHFTTTAPASFGDIPMGYFDLPTHGLFVYQDAYGGAIQEFSLADGWNWFAPTVGMSVNALKYQLGSNVEIVTHDANLSDDIIPGQMLKINVDEGGLFTLLGRAIAANITIEEGINWIGYTGGTTTNISTGLTSYGITPNIGDKIISQDNGFAIFNGTSWEGTLTSLEQGKGYVYVRVVR